MLPARQGVSEGVPGLLRPGQQARLSLQELQHCLLQTGELGPTDPGETLLIAAGARLLFLRVRGRLLTWIL